METSTRGAAEDASATLSLLERRSSAAKLRDPAPGPALLERLVRAALRAPAHANLHPYRILVVEGEGRARLGELMAESARRKSPKITEAMIEAARQKPLRAPMIIVVACVPRLHPKVPEIEQVLSTGCVVHALLIGLQAEGFGGMWRTGPAAYDPELKTGLGLRAEDHLVGFLYVGTPDGPPPELARPEVTSFVSRWP